MNVFKRYIFAQTFFLTIGVTAVLSIAVWLTHALRFIDYVMSRGLSMLMFGKLSLLLLPGLVSVILPIGFFISVLFVLSKLYSDSELTVMRSLGLSNFQILNPCILAGLIFLVSLYGVNFYAQPMAKSEFVGLRDEIRNNLTGQWIQPGTFMSIKGVTFYTKEKTRSGSMKGIFVYDSRIKGQESTITAELGQIYEVKGGLKFILYKGSRQGVDHKTGKPNILNFEQYSVDLKSDNDLVPRQKKVTEMSMGELFNFDESASTIDKALIRIETHERLLLPLLMFPFVLFAGIAFLLGDYNRRGKTKRIVMASVSCILIEVGVMTMLNLSEKISYLVDITYYSLFILIIISAKFLTYPKLKSSWLSNKDENKGEFLS